MSRASGPLFWDWGRSWGFAPRWYGAGLRPLAVVAASGRFGEGLRFIFEAGAWLVAGAWCWRTSDAVRGLPTVAELTGIEWDVKPEELPSLMVVVPARNEEAKIAATLDALLLADLPGLRVLVVDDRSEDRTGLIMDAYATEYALEERSKPEGLKPHLPESPMRPKAEALGYPSVAEGNLNVAEGYANVAEKGVSLQVLHIRELPEGWLGKTHALACGVERCETEFVLFTDADVLFSPSVLRRAMVYAVASEADHLVVLPTMQVKTWGEGVVLGFFQVMGLWASRPWRVSDPTSSRDLIGVGAFNLVRRSALEAIGGWEPQRMVILEDITLGRRMKAAGMRQRIAFAPGLVLVHWASGARGLVGVMTKNLFSAFNFRPVLLLGACGWIVVFCLLPVVGLGWGRTVAPSLLVMMCVAATYRAMGRASSIDARYGWLYSLGAGAFVWAMLRSMVTVWRDGGVRWRGTLYALKELRLHNSPWRWRRRADPRG